MSNSRNNGLQNDELFYIQKYEEFQKLFGIMDEIDDMIKTY